MIEVKKFRKKPVVIEALQFHVGQYTVDELEKFVTCEYEAQVTEQSRLVVDLDIKTLEGHHIVSDEDWIIKGVKGEFYPCKPDIFRNDL